MSELAPLPKHRGHLSFIWLGVILVILGVAQVRLQSGTTTPTTTDPLAVQTVGEEAPDFTVRLLNHDGTFTLSDSLATEGKPVILNFWASWCYPCRAEMPLLDATAQARPDLVFIGVATDDTEYGASEFAEEINVSYPLGLDSTGVVGQRYGALALPLTVVIDRDGVIVTKKLGELTEETLGALLESLDS